MSDLLTLATIEQSLIAGRPRRRFVVPGVLPAGPCFLYGASGTGKTGIAVRTAMAIAGGLQWAGKAVSPGCVLYVAGEDYEGVKERLVAAARFLGRDTASIPLAIMEPGAEGLVSRECANEVIQKAQELAKEAAVPVALVVIDTLGACFGDESQDDARSATKVTHNIDRISRRLGCPVLSLHHTGKRGADMRGSQVFFDRADSVVKASRQKGGVTFLEVEKLRNGIAGERFSFDIGAFDIAVGGERVSVQVVRDLKAIEVASSNFDDEVARQRQSQADIAFGILSRLSVDGEASLVKRSEDLTP